MTKWRPKGSRFYFRPKKNWDIEAFNFFFRVKIMLSGCLNVTQGWYEIIMGSSVVQKSNISHFYCHMITMVFRLVCPPWLQPVPDLGVLSALPLELCVWWEPDIHPVHDTLSGQTGSAAASGHQGGFRPGWLHDRAVGPDICGGPAFPGPQADLQRQQEHRRAQSKTSPAPFECWNNCLFWCSVKISRSKGHLVERLFSKKRLFMNCNKF